jgi:hypothetical protein
MRFSRLSGHITFLCLLFLAVYFSACESKSGITYVPKPNPYGEGNGKITFYRTEQMAGTVTIKISNKQLNDTIVWNKTPDCDTNFTASFILKAGNYYARIEGNTFLCDYNVTVEEEKCKLLNYTNCIGGNPYGEGNGKITFYRTQQIAGPVIIKITNNQLNDTIVWQAAPNCDAINAASLILKAGNYSVRIEGNVFLCDYNVNVEEKKCKLLDYTNCGGGYVGCYELTGIWLRTSDGPCPNCMGLKIQFADGLGEVIYTPPGCRFPLGDIKWKDFNISNCSILDLARDQYGGSPEYQSSNVNFFRKDSLIINGPSGQIPYSRISTIIDKNIIKNINPAADSVFIPYPAVLQSGQ